LAGARVFRVKSSDCVDRTSPPAMPYPRVRARGEITGEVPQHPGPSLWGERVLSPDSLLPGATKARPPRSPAWHTRKRTHSPDDGLVACDLVHGMRHNIRQRAVVRGAGRAGQSWVCGFWVRQHQWAVPMLRRLRAARRLLRRLSLRVLRDGAEQQTASGRKRNKGWQPRQRVRCRLSSRMGIC
jgi:hypothetical protein